MPMRLNKIATEFHITLNEIACFLLPKRNSGGGKSSSWLGNFKGYMRIVSVPFGVMKKR